MVGETDEPTGTSVSIITVVLNDLEGLQRTWRSIQSQDCEDYEWVVIDGGSTDGTCDFLRSLRSSCVVWRSEGDRGLYDAMNKGTDQAQGRYVWYLNAGDEVAASRTLATIIGSLGADPDFVYGDALDRTVEGRLLLKRARPHARIWRGMFTHHQAMVFRRTTIDGLRYLETYPVGADYAFVAEVLARCKEVRYLDTPFCVFEGGGYSATHAWLGLRDQFDIRRTILGMSRLMCLGIAAWQAMVLLIARVAPRLFEVVRYEGTGTRLDR